MRLPFILLVSLSIAVGTRLDESIMVSTLVANKDSTGLIDGGANVAQVTSIDRMLLSRVRNTLYWTEQLVVRSLNLNTQVVTTVRDVGEDPSGITFASTEENRLIVCDREAHILRVLDLMNLQNLTQYAGVFNASGHIDGISGTARFESPEDIVLDTSTKVVYLAEQKGVIRRITNSSSILNVTTLSGERLSVKNITRADGSLKNARFGFLRSLQIFDTELFLLDSDRSDTVVRQISLSTFRVSTTPPMDYPTFPAAAPPLHLGLGVEDLFNFPISLIISDPVRNIIWRQQLVGNTRVHLLGTIGTNGSQDGVGPNNTLFNQPSILVYDSPNQKLYIAERNAIRMAQTIPIALATSSPSTRSPIPAASCVVVPEMASNTDPCGIAFSNGQGEPFNVFDRRGASGWNSGFVPFNTSSFLGYKFRSGVKRRVTRYGILFNDSMTRDRSLKSWVLQASNDNLTYADLDIRENATLWYQGEWRFFTITNVENYSIYRLSILADHNPGGFVPMITHSIGELRLEDALRGPGGCESLCSGISPSIPTVSPSIAPMPPITCNVVPEMTSNTDPCGVVFGNTFSNGQGKPFNVFDRRGASGWTSGTVPFNTSSFLGYKFRSGVKRRVTRYGILFNDPVTRDRSLKSWVLQASNDNLTYADLDIRENATLWYQGEWRFFTITNVQNYSIYRLSILADHNPGGIVPLVNHSIGELRLEDALRGPGGCEKLCGEVATQSPTTNPTTRTPTQTMNPTRSPSSNPISSTPTISPSSSSPATMNPTNSPTTTSPSSNSPTTVNPTCAPSLSPTSSSPSSSSPITATPTLGSVSGYFFSPDTVFITESFPPWDIRNDVEGSGTGRFFVQNLLPSSQTIEVQCIAESGPILLRRVDIGAQIVGTNGFSLKGTDPTKFECRTFSNGNTTISCNGGVVGSANRSTTISVDECNSISLTQKNILQPQIEGNPFGCPNPCYETQDGCSGGSVGVYAVSSQFVAGNNPDSIARGRIACTLRRGTGAGTQQIGVRVQDVVWPAIADLLIESPRGGFISARTAGEDLRGQGDRPPYSVTLNSATKIVAVADQILGGEFPDSSAGQKCPNVTVAGKEVQVLSCSPSNVSFVTPLFSTLCTQSECGYQNFSIVNYDGIRPGAKGAAIECPGSCPLSGLGFFYTEKCVNFKPVEECNVPSTECAFGAGDSCRGCDENAICPGGFRMWPVAGFWTSSEKAGSVVQCPAPPLERCEGWDVSSAVAACAEGYTGDLCSSCSDGYYGQLALCFKCPPSGESAFRLAFLIMICLVLFLMVYAFLHCSPIATGKGPIYKELLEWQAKDFVIWSMLLLQLFSTTIGTAGANARAVTELFAWMSVVSFDTQAVGPECFSTSAQAFTREYIIFTCILLALVIQGLLAKGAPLGCLPKAKEWRGTLMKFLIFGYTPTTFTAFGAAYCIESNSENRENTLVSWVNPNFECAGAVHGPVMGLAVAIIVLHSVSFPLWSFYKIRSIYHAPSSVKIMKMRALHYRKFFSDDYLPEYYWLLHASMFIAFLLCCTRVYLSAFRDADQIARMILNITFITAFASIVVWLQPFVRHMTWKLPVLVSLSILLDFTSVLEFLNYKYAKQEASLDVVEGFSLFVLGLALFNFVLLMISFWFVVFREKESNYYMEHFVMQKLGTISMHKSFRSRGGSRVNSRRSSRKNSRNIDSMGIASPIDEHHTRQADSFANVNLSISQSASATRPEKKNQKQSSMESIRSEFKLQERIKRPLRSVSPRNTGVYDAFGFNPRNTGGYDSSAAGSELRPSEKQLEAIQMSNRRVISSGSQVIRISEIKQTERKESR